MLFIFELSACIPIVYTLNINLNQTYILNLRIPIVLMHLSISDSERKTSLCILATTKYISI